MTDVTRELDPEAVQRRAHRITTTDGKVEYYPDDVRERDFTAHRPGTRLVGDVSLLRTTQGWLC